MVYFLITAISLIPVSPGVRSHESVGMLERNHVFQVREDGSERRQFTQWIFWQWDDHLDRWQVVAWRWDRKHNGDHVASHLDIGARELSYCTATEFRRIRFQVWRETSTSKDHEVWESQHHLPRVLRAGLQRVFKPAGD